VGVKETVLGDVRGGIRVGGLTAGECNLHEPNDTYDVIFITIAVVHWN
jgi:hypothetical protein